MRPRISRWSTARHNDLGILLQEHHADPEREPPGECCRTLTAYPVSSKPLLERGARSDGARVRGLRRSLS